jgi:hypothetical protein
VVGRLWRRQSTDRIRRADRQRTYAADHENSKFSALRAPATSIIWTTRSPVSGDHLLSLAAFSIPARSPFSVMFSGSTCDRHSVVTIARAPFQLPVDLLLQLGGTDSRYSLARDQGRPERVAVGGDDVEGVKPNGRRIAVAERRYRGSSSVVVRRRRARANPRT